MAVKLPTRALKKAGRYAAAGVVGLVVGVIGTLFIVNWNPKDVEEVDSASIVFSRIVEQNELVCASQDYTIVEKAGDTNKLFDWIEIPFTDNSFWYRYSGTLKASVNLESAEYSRTGTSIVITLNQPYISSNTPDMETSGVLEERNNILNPIHVEDVDDFQRECISKSQQQAIDGDLFDEARANAEDNLARMFTAALGDDYSVSVEWRDEPTGTE